MRFAFPAFRLLIVRLSFFAIFLSSCPLIAAELIRADVKETNGEYRVDFEVLIQARLDEAITIIQDSENLHKLSPSVISSRVINDDGSQDYVEVVLRPCVFIVFCKTVKKVTQVQTDMGQGIFVHTVVPALSDFHSAEETVRLSQAEMDNQAWVRFSYQAFLQPKFYVPPFIGPWIVRKQIIRELRTTTDHIESMTTE